MSSERERWINRPAFVMAAIGSAVGLGNIWRFPYVAYENGGGAFLIPYFVALLTAGIPLMIVEYGLGHMEQGSAPASLAGIARRSEWIGWWALVVGSIISFYYAVVMAWCWDYLWYSPAVSWQENAKAFFFNRILQISDGPAELGGLSIPVLIGLAITWLSIFLIVYKGVHRVGKVVMVTVPLPVILIAAMFIRGLTLKGSLEGLAFYLTPDFGKLLRPRVWLDAYSQVFFSLSLGFGILIAYASYLPRKSDINNNAFITSLADCGISYFAGFAVFSVLGYLSTITGMGVDSVVDKGPSLAFITYPIAIKNMPLSPLWGIVFFATLITLGIDSAFSIVEGVVAGLMDKWGIPRFRATLYFCILGLLAGLLFASKAGLYWLDIVDHWMTNFGLAFVGFLECIVIGYFFSTRTFRDYVNSCSDFKVGIWWDVMIKFVTPLMLGILLVFNFINEVKTPYEGYPMWAIITGGWGLSLAAALLGVGLMKIGNREG